MIDLYVVRHGNTFDKGDVVTRVGARTDLPLSSSGRAQAEALAAHFAGVTFASATCSPLRRTGETAEIVLAGRDDAPEVRVEDFLTEIDYGPDENQPEEAVVARLGEDALARWDREAEMPMEWSPRPMQIQFGWMGWLAELVERARDGSAHLVVTSNGIARFIPDVVALDKRPQDIKLKTGAYAHLRISEGLTGQVLAWNARP